MDINALITQRVMTNTDIAREIDALIEERLWLRTVERDAHGAWDMYVIVEGVAREVPHYSADIAAAKRAQAAMVQRGYAVTIKQALDIDQGEVGVWLRRNSLDTGPADGHGQAKTEAEAICLAILSALEKEADARTMNEQDFIQTIAKIASRDPGGFFWHAGRTIVGRPAPVFSPTGFTPTITILTPRPRWRRPKRRRFARPSGTRRYGHKARVRLMHEAAERVRRRLREYYRI